MGGLARCRGLERFHPHSAANAAGALLDRRVWLRGGLAGGAALRDGIWPGHVAGGAARGAAAGGRAGAVFSGLTHYYTGIRFLELHSLNALTGID